MTLDQAISLARTAHAGATDKAGRPYIEHSLRVMERLRADSERFAARIGDPQWVDRPDEQAALVAAILHDVLEDTPLVAEDLISRGCPEKVVEVVVLLTRLPEESYEAFLRRLAPNPIARRVKRADIDDNSDESRLAVLSEAQAARLREKYGAARRLLDDLSAYERVSETIASHPDGHYRYFLNDKSTIGLMRQWRWDEDGREGGGWSWPEYLHPETTAGRWKVGNAYMLDAITGLGEDPYSCGEWCKTLTADEAIRVARKMGVDLVAARIAP
jgi:hypothetical protein